MSPRSSAPPSTGRFTTPDPSLPRVLDAHAVTVAIGGRTIVEDVTFWIPKGEFVCLCGPNGAGKTTFLKAVLGLLPLASGSITILGQDARKSGRKIGYVPQRKTSDVHFPASAVDLIVANLRGAWPLRIKEEERERARIALSRVGGERLLDKPLSGLSGGETQRVFLARALVTGPELLVLDEPTAGVDVQGRAEFVDLLAQISQNSDMAALLVSHNLSVVARCAERIVYLDAGRLTAWGLPRDLLGRANLSALAFGGVDHGKIPDEE